MTRRKVTIKRLSASELRPKEARVFSVKKFIQASKNLEEALKKEEIKYGKSSGVLT